MSLQRRNDPNDLSWDWRAALSAGRLANASGSPERALEAFREALSLAQLSHDKGGEAEALNSIGVTLADLGRLDEAATSFRQVLAASADDAGATTASKINLAQVMTQLGEHAAAVDLLVSTLASVTQETQPIEWATLLNNLGIVLSELGRSDEAISALRQALAIAPTIFGERHPRTVALLGNLGIALRRKGNYAEAETVLRNAIAAAEATMGPTHPATQSLRAELQAA